MEEFVTVDIRRGFTEVEQVFMDAARFGAFICGGYARYCASPLYKPVPASDVDVYCPSIEVFKETERFLKLEKKLEVRAENEMAITFKHPSEGSYFYCPPVQLIKPVKKGQVVAMGSMEEVLFNFDFTVIRAGILNDSYVLADKDFLEDERKRILRIKKIHCPISSTLRCMKYSRKGYWLKPMEVIKLLTDWENRDDNYRMQIVDLLRKSAADPKSGLTKEEVETLEALMRID